MENTLHGQKSVAIIGDPALFGIGIRTLQFTLLFMRTRQAPLFDICDYFYRLLDKFISLNISIF
ncbi:MAG TPA: hypothetical protein DHU63_09965 [Candidatus Marinimicrobia bacterium]|nr:MAG: hypothetical protein AUJ47_00055 [Candidatus Marinimicrobia bacterium CG1_02_48_14]PIZ65402.1 MAG: hypothetical protein COY19_07980 [Candidatus Marinimicrobia bacterium CG_4_10_14_0_2_um_filter_48_9]PJA51529.1 MAG: hypothetical protein CO167_13485 [Candidatus Marinimicrobia bacterium CG_4_9_14_3_um_filter_48_9]HCW76847.1 hypothetical protein [Candidatus Neomarinimicrobiota bacterium]